MGSGGMGSAARPGMEARHRPAVHAAVEPPRTMQAAEALGAGLRGERGRRGNGGDRSETQPRRDSDA